MISPTPGTILPGASVSFAWNAGSGVSQYWLYVGTTSAGSDIYNLSQGANLSTTVNGLPTDGRTVYVRLWSLIDNGWQWADYSYTAGSLSQKAALTSPAPGSTLAGASVTFGWNTGSGVSQYWLYVGTSAGANDLYSQSTDTNQSAAVSSLPTDGRTIFVRLWSLIGASWQFSDYTYTAGTVAAQKAVLTSPTPGSTLAGASVTFGWNTGSGVSQYWLYVGNSVGANDFYNQSTGSSQSAAVSSLPTDGRTIFVRLWSLIGSNWQFSDYTYTAGTLGQKAALTSPTPGSTLAGAFVTFGWITGSGVSQYWLYVGNSAGANDLFNQSTGTNQSAAVSSLPTDGRTIFVRLWSLIGNSWQFNDYTYTAGTAAAQKAVLTSPAPGSTLAGASVTFGWNTGSGVSQYWLYVGNSAGANDLYNQSTGTNRSAAVSSLPTDGRTIYVRLWSLIGSWQFSDYTYTAGTLGQKAALTSPAPGSTLAGASVTFGWNTGSAVTQYWLYVGNSAGANDLFDQSTGINQSAAVSSLPTDGRTLYVRLWSLIGDWVYNDYTYTTVTISSAQFLSFPLTALYPQGAYTAGMIISVLDHHMDTGYVHKDGIILSFTGEWFQYTDQYPIGGTAACYPKAGNPTWSSLLAGLYKGTPGTGSNNCLTNHALNYEAHPGYDYVASGALVTAAAIGTVVSLNKGCVPKGISEGCEAWGAVGIDHGNGYISQYLHLKSIYVFPGQVISEEGWLIGQSGQTSPANKPVGPHLHFEVLKLRSGFVNDYQPASYATVDPYGFDTSKGNSDYITKFNNNLPNICLWKVGC